MYRLTLENIKPSFFYKMLQNPLQSLQGYENEVEIVSITCSEASGVLPHLWHPGEAEGAGPTRGQVTYYTAP